MGELLDALFFRKGYREAVVIALWCALAFLIGSILVGQLIWQPEIDARNQAEKTKLDSMSCQDLGKWIIDQSQNQDDYYPYAQAKYLVCTHGGISP